MRSLLTFVLWCWTPQKPNKYYTYTAARVNAMVEMLAKHYRKPHRVVCITDNPRGMMCETRQLWDEWRNVAVAKNMPPQSWARLGLFAPWAEGYIGAEHVVSVDLDSVIVDDVTDIFEERHDFKGWLSRGYRATPCIYNASLFMLRLGAHPEVYNTFKPDITPAYLKQRGYIGTEQAHHSFILGDKQPAWTWRDGICSYRFQVRHSLVANGGNLPLGARWVFMHGSLKPWTCKDKFCIEHYPTYGR